MYAIGRQKWFSDTVTALGMLVFPLGQPADLGDLATATSDSASTLEKSFCCDRVRTGVELKERNLGFPGLSGELRHLEFAS